MEKRETAGEKTLKAAKDTTKYDSLEIGHAMVEDNSIESGLYECVERHKNIFNEDEFCVGYVIASDPLIKGIMRRKFFAMLYLPSPRPEQAVFLYNKKLDQITKRLWVLPAAFSHNPEAWTMEKLYLSPIVPKGYHTMKRWSHSFYEGNFWEAIRLEHDIDMLSEHEYLAVNREKLIKAGCKYVETLPTDPFDFSKIGLQEVTHSTESLFDEGGFDCGRQAQNA